MTKPTNFTRIEPAGRPFQVESVRVEDRDAHLKVSRTMHQYVDEISGEVDASVGQIFDVVIPLDVLRALVSLGDPLPKMAPRPDRDTGLRGHVREHASGIIERVMDNALRYPSMPGQLNKAYALPGVSHQDLEESQYSFSESGDIFPVHAARIRLSLHLRHALS